MIEFFRDGKWKMDTAEARYCSFETAGFKNGQRAGLCQIAELKKLAQL